jgi:CheY-like chemotaxis protein
MFEMSFALLDASGRLVDWNGDFAAEFGSSDDLIYPGAPWATLVAAAERADGIRRGPAAGATIAASPAAAAAFEYATDFAQVAVRTWTTAQGSVCRIAECRPLTTGQPLSLAPSASPDLLATILLVDDNDLVRETVAAQLEAMSYRVHAVEGPADALIALERDPSVELLLTDVVMPGSMNGPELARKARDMRPALKVVFTSGYSAATLVADGRLPAGAELLQKPYDYSELESMLSRCLGPPRSARAASG